jgi:hypothetical protein
MLPHHQVGTSITTHFDVGKIKVRVLPMLSLPHQLIWRTLKWNAVARF